MLSAIPLPDPIKERSRIRLLYDKLQLDYNAAKTQMVSETHMVWAQDEEILLWQQGQYDETLKRA